MRGRHTEVSGISRKPEQIPQQDFSSGSQGKTVVGPKVKSRVDCQACHDHYSDLLAQVRKEKFNLHDLVVYWKIGLIVKSKLFDSVIDSEHYYEAKINQ